MEAVAEKQKTAAEKSDPTRKQIRGSSLLLAGRFISTGLNFVSQILIVRHLSTTEYGAWTYALAMVAFFQGISTLGLRRGITRFVPIYHENDEFDKLFGTIFMVLGTIAFMAVLIVGGIHFFPELITRLINDKDQPIFVIMILIFMVPVEAIDGLLIALFASFSSPKLIFFRKHIMGPCLKVAVVLLLVFFNTTVLFLAYGWIFANALAVLIYVGMLIRMMRQRGFLAHFNLQKIRMPVKEIFSFTIPLMTSDLVNIVMHSVDTLLLGYYHNASEVAAYRVILPAAHFNKIVMASFGLLYTPLAARLFAKRDFAGINDLYWRTAVWMSILSFPVFALTFSLAQPLTVLLYGARYESSWLLLHMLSFAYYFNAVLGFNGLTLKVLGKIRYVVIINFAAALTNICLALILIPRYGALGAAIGTSVAMIVHNILKQAGLRLASGMMIFEWKYLSFYMIIAAGAIGLFLIQFFLTASIYISMPLAMLVSLIIFAVTRRKLDIEDTFPELLKVPVLGWILGGSSTTKKTEK
ncbi:flippase [candidate division KSB1 bacterium]|nr:flippase [candidate division KSB1 bacterium]